MSTFHITNFGCRATQADAAAIHQQLLERGFAPGLDPSRADLVVIHTCTVTAAADAQARQAIRRARRANPRARIVVTGCYAQRAPEELATMEGVSLVVGNSHQTELGELLARHTGFVSLGALSTAPSPQKTGAAPILAGELGGARKLVAAPAWTFSGQGQRTRPVLKIQDGCNHRCAYCIIPTVRGPSRSLPPDDVVGEIRRLAAAGYKEVVLSGINLGSYGRDLVPRTGLMDLLPRILRETPLERLRLSSIEPMDITEELVAVVASSDRIARHFHVPLQSGSDRILKAMHRWYRAEHYARRIELVRERLPDAAIGADVIAGFPGETETDHAATRELVRRLPFTYLHVFAYSKRPGTRAAALPGEVPPEVIRRRSRELRTVAEEKAGAFCAANLGRTLRVLTLGRTNGTNGEAWTAALSDNYLEVRLRGYHPAHRMLDVRATATAGGSLLAETV